MNIINDQGLRPAIIDAVAPFLERLKDVLPLFEEPAIYVGDGAIVAGLHLSSKWSALPADTMEQILRAARETDHVCRVSVSDDRRIEINIYGFAIF